MWSPLRAEPIQDMRRIATCAAKRAGSAPKLARSVDSQESRKESSVLGHPAVDPIRNPGVGAEQRRQRPSAWQRPEKVGRGRPGGLHFAACHQVPRLEAPLGSDARQYTLTVLAPDRDRTQAPVPI